MWRCVFRMDVGRAGWQLWLVARRTADPGSIKIKGCEWLEDLFDLTELFLGLKYRARGHVRRLSAGTGCVFPFSFFSFFVVFFPLSSSRVVSVLHGSMYVKFLVFHLSVSMRLPVGNAGTIPCYWHCRDCRASIERFMNVERLFEWELAGETEVLGENPPQCHFVQGMFQVPAVYCALRHYNYRNVKFSLHSVLLFSVVIRFVYKYSLKPVK
jgi:hypothetical protein